MLCIFYKLATTPKRVCRFHNNRSYFSSILRSFRQEPFLTCGLLLLLFFFFLPVFSNLSTGSPSQSQSASSPPFDSQFPNPSSRGSSLLSFVHTSPPQIQLMMNRSFERMNLDSECHHYTIPALNDVDSDGKLEVILGAADGHVYALNVEDNSTLWDWDLPASQTLESSPILVNHDNDPELELIFGTSETSVGGHLYVMHAENGSLLWDKSYNTYMISAPAVVDVNNDSRLDIILGCYDQTASYIRAFNGENGDKLWDYPLDYWTWGPNDPRPNAEFSNLVLEDIDGDNKLEVLVVYARTTSGKLIALNTEDGTFLWRDLEIWRGEFRNIWASTPALADIDNDERYEIVVATPFNEVIALNGATGAELWRKRHTTTEWITGASPTLADIDNDRKLEVLMSATIPDQGQIYTLNLEDGSLLWAVNISEPILSSITLADFDNDDKLEAICGSANGSVYALHAENGKLLWTYSLNEIPVRWNIGCTMMADLDNDSQLEVVACGYNRFISENYVLGSPRKLYVLDIGETGSRIYWQGSRGTTGYNLTTNLFDIDPDMDFLSSYSENILGTDPGDRDTDNDGLWDGWEVSFGLNPITTNNAAGDPDSDGLTNQEEHDLPWANTWMGGLDPTKPDTDGDGLPDYNETKETKFPGLDPTNPDTDRDGLTDGEEVLTYDTNPTLPDSDGDTLSDYNETKILGLDPTNPDTDGDGLYDNQELKWGYNPTNPDTDGDGLDDGVELVMRLDPTNPDTDGDGLEDGVEIDLNLDPNNWDTDRDGDGDGFELTEWLLDPHNPYLNTNTRQIILIATPSIPVAGVIGMMTYRKREWIKRQLSNIVGMRAQVDLTEKDVEDFVDILTEQFSNNKQE